MSIYWRVVFRARRYIWLRWNSLGNLKVDAG